MCCQFPPWISIGSLSLLFFAKMLPMGPHGESRDPPKIPVFAFGSAAVIRLSFGRHHAGAQQLFAHSFTSKPVVFSTLFSGKKMPMKGHK